MQVTRVRRVCAPSSLNRRTYCTKTPTEFKHIHPHIKEGTQNKQVTPEEITEHPMVPKRNIDDPLIRKQMQHPSKIEKKPQGQEDA